MINKRLLIKNLLSHNDENSFYDKKQKLSLHSKEGKAKFIKHICALSNSNPNNNSYILIIKMNNITTITISKKLHHKRNIICAIKNIKLNK